MDPPTQSFRSSAERIQFCLDWPTQPRPKQKRIPTIDPEEFIHRLSDAVHWCPPALIPAEQPRSEDSMMKFTIPLDLYGKNNVAYPQFYNRHLDDALVVKEIVLLDGLLKCFADLTDRYIDDLFQTGQLPQRATFLLSPDPFEWRDTTIEMRQIEAERDVADNFSESVTHNCFPIASALALHPKNWEGALITWNNDPRWRKWGDITDGAWQFPVGLKHRQLGDSSIFKPILDVMDEDLKLLLPTMARGFNPLAIWHFKTLSDGDETVMKEIVAMGRGEKCFRWSFCSKLSDLSGSTTLKVKDEMPEKPKRIARRGPDVDSRNPPWKNLISASDSPLNHPVSNPRKRRHSTGMGSDANLSPLNRIPHKDAESTFSVEEIHDPGLAIQDEEASPSANAKEEQESNVVPVSGERNSSIATSRPCERRDSAHQIQADLNPSIPTIPDLQEAKAQSFIQQAWAEAVRNRCSVLVIHSGNHEIIGIRDRKSQRLYIAELVHPHKPPHGLDYGEIQVGLCISIIRDVIDRARQFEEQQAERMRATTEAASAGQSKLNEGARENQGQPEPAPSTLRDNSGNDKGLPTGTACDGPKDGGKGSLRSSQESHTSESPQVLLDLAKTRNLVFLYLRYDLYNSLVPAPFLRHGYNLPGSSSATTLQSPGKSISIPSAEESIDLILMSQMTVHSTGIVHIGVIEFSGHSRNIPVVVKLGFSRYEKRILQKEYMRYCQLEQAGVKGVPECIGLFTDVDHYREEDETIVEGPFALVMKNAGRSLYKSAHTIPRNLKISLVMTLTSMHSAGIMHGGIRDTNLCRLNENEVFIIDLSHTSRYPSAEEKGEELAKLCKLLQLDLKEAQEAILASQLASEKHEQDAQGRPVLRRSERVKSKMEGLHRQNTKVQVLGDQKQEHEPEVIQTPRQSLRLKAQEIQRQELFANLAKEIPTPGNKDDGTGKRKSGASTRKRKILETPRAAKKLKVDGDT